MEQEGFAWWIERLRANLRLADFVRLDHFRAFAAFWEVPATERTAVHGVWSEGPGRRLFTAVRRALGDVPVVAEDLGHITPDVIDLRTKLGMPGMKVLQFAFGEPESEHRPERAERDDVIYTGTHDNDTSRGWFASLPDDEKRNVIDGLRGAAQGDDGPPAGDGGTASAPGPGETAGRRGAREGLLGDPRTPPSPDRFAQESAGRRRAAPTPARGATGIEWE
jgi:4-alpha-glucanotransferase